MYRAVRNAVGSSVVSGALSAEDGARLVNTYKQRLKSYTYLVPS